MSLRVLTVSRLIERICFGYLINLNFSSMVKYYLDSIIYRVKNNVNRIYKRKVRTGGYELYNIMNLYNNYDIKIDKYFNNAGINGFYQITLSSSSFEFEVKSTSKPMTIKEWSRKCNANVLINGGYHEFNSDYTPSGFVKAENKTYGKINPNFRGFVGFDESSVTIDWIDEDSDLSFKEYSSVIQSGPLIIEPTGQRGILTKSSIRERRTVVSCDKTGNVVFTIFPYSTVSLYEVMLVLERFNFNVSINLDGGPSSGMLIDDSGFYHHIPSLRKVPNVIAITRKKNLLYKEH